MKNKFKVLGIIAVVMAVLAFTACGGASAGGGGTPPTETPATFSSTDSDGNTYELTFFTAAKAVHQPQKGSAYELKYNGKATKSGTVTDVKGKDFVLTPTGSAQSVTITIDNGSMITIVGVIIYPNGDVAVEIKTAKPLTPSTSSGVIFQITIPIDYSQLDGYDRDDGMAQTDFYWVVTGDGIEHISKWIESPDIRANGKEVTIKLGAPYTALLQPLPLPFGENLTISPNNVKGFWYINEFSTYGGEFTLSYITDNNYNRCHFIYVDKDATIKGTAPVIGDEWLYRDEYGELIPNPNFGKTIYTEKYDVSLKKGWNLMLNPWGDEGDTVTVTASTTLPSGFKYVMEGGFR